MTAQDFVDQLNHAEMPRLGYELVRTASGGVTLEHWCFPVYDRAHSDIKDFDSRDPIAAQRKRGVAPKYSAKYPANQRTRERTQ
jgi:hypothetical protein